MNCQRDKSEKGSRELYNSGLSNCLTTLPQKEANVRIVRLFPTSEATAHSVITADCWAEVRLGTKWTVTILKARTTGLGVRECLGLLDQYRTERLCS